MRDLSYEDLETEAVKEREEHEQYEADCARENEQESAPRATTFLVSEPPPVSSYMSMPTPTKAQKVKETAEIILLSMQHDGKSTNSDRTLCRLIIRLAQVVDEH